MSLAIAEIVSPELGILSGENRYKSLVDGHYSDREHKVFITGKYALGLVGNYGLSRRLRAAINTHPPSFNALLDDLVQFLRHCRNAPPDTIAVLVMGFDEQLGRVRLVTLNGESPNIEERFLPVDMTACASGAGAFAASDYIRLARSRGEIGPDMHVRCYQAVAERENSCSSDGLVAVVTREGVAIHNEDQFTGYLKAGAAAIDLASGIHLNKILDNVGDGATFRRLANVDVDNTFHVSPSLNNQGSIIPNQPLNTPSFTTATTSISITWGSQSMKLSDGTVITVAAGSKSYSSLSASTTYHLYPFVRLSDNTIQFANATPPPTSANAAAVIAANLDGCYSMSPFNVTTPASGTGSGGGGGSCPDGSELVDVQGKGETSLRDVRLGDMLRGYSFTQKADVYRKVTSVRSSGAAAWRIVNGHKVSPAEPVWDGNAFTPAFRIPGSVFDPSHGEKYEIHVDADDSEANYWLVSGTPLLTHNFLPS
jgi:hypothetical protein